MRVYIHIYAQKSETGMFNAGRRKDASFEYSALIGHVNPRKSISHFLLRFPESTNKY